MAQSSTAPGAGAAVSGHSQAVATATAMNPYRLRRATEVDVPALERIERAAFPTLSVTTPFRKEVRRETSLYLLAVRSPAAHDSGAGRFGKTWPDRLLRRVLSALLFERQDAQEGPGEVAAGEVGVWFVLDECHIVTLATEAQERRRGVGELLLIGVLEAALQRGCRMVTLEVRASNGAARALYRKYGFADEGVRKRYYSDNHEDAIIMTTPDIRSEEYRARLARLVRAHAEQWGESVRSLG